MNQLRRILQNTSILLAGQILGTGLTFAASIFLVRSLGSEGYGHYAVVYAFLTLLTWLVTFGTENILVREAAQAPEKADEIWSTGILIQAGLSGAAFGIAVLIAMMMGYGQDTLALIAIGAVEMIVLVPWRLVGRIFQVELQQWRGVLATLIRQMLWLGILILFSLQEEIELPGLLGARTAVAGLEVALMWWLVRPFFRFKPKLNKQRIVSLLGQSWPLALNALSVAIYHRIDQVLVERYLSTQDLGLYAAAVNLAGLISLAPLAFMSSLYPILCKWSDQMLTFERISSLSFRWLITISGGLAGVMTFLGQPLVVLIYGKEMAFSGVILSVLVWVQVIICYGIILTQILLSKGLQRYLTVATLIGALFSVFGNIFVLPRLGVVGAAWIMLLSQILTAVVIFSLIPATRKLNRLGVRILGKVIIVCIISFIIPKIIITSIWTLGIISIGLYLLNIYVFKIITPEDLGLLKKTISSLNIIKVGT